MRFTGCLGRRGGPAIAGVVVLTLGPAAYASGPVRLVQTIPLPGVAGRIDHMDLDRERGRLFIAARGNNSLEVVDLRSGKRARSVPGFDAPQGVSFVGGTNRLFVANGGSGACEMLDGTTFRLIRSVNYAGDADNLRLDPVAKRIYVGYGNGGLGIIDAETGASRGSIPLEVHPESFQLEFSGSRIFVNLPDAREIAVVDRRSGRVATDWPCACEANYPMALDEAGHRLFVGCRHPGSVLVYDTASGQRIDSIPISGDVDDLFYDGDRRRIYAACGAGFLDVLGERRTGRYAPIGRIPTGRNARTALFVPELRRLYVAVPRAGAQRAEIRVFETVP